MSRRSSSDLSVSLFPFLAVLVCVMGSLIFLLLATTKRMHDIALAEAEAERLAALAPQLSSPQQELAAVSDIPAVKHPHVQLGTPTELEPLEPVQPAGPSAAEQEFEQRRRQLQQEYLDQLAQLEQQRDKLRDAWRRQQTLHQAAKAKVTELEDTVGQTETRLRGVLAEVEALEEDQIANADLSKLEQEIIELRKKLRLLQNKPTEGNTKYAVIPFDVRSGTTRRPILIECTDHGLRFLPEEIVILPSELEGFSDRYNPLLSGATALVNYWTDWSKQQKDPEHEPEPYVLLIVRPNGTVAYYVAMKMLSALKTPFGYELVDDAVVLQPPPLDPLAKAACRDAIQQLLSEREEVTRHVRDGFRRGGNGNGKGNGTASGGRGKGGKGSEPSKDTFEVSDVVPPSNSVGERSWENIERFEGRRAGTGPGAAPGKESTPKASGRPMNSPVAGAPGGSKPARVARAANAGQPSPASTRPASATPDELAESPSVEDLAEEAGQGESRDSSAPRSYQPGQRPPGGQNGPRGPRPPHGQRPAHGKEGQGEFRLEHLARRHWGESEPTATIGIEQNVTIRIDGQRIVVAEDRMVRYQPDEEPLQVFLRLMDAVDQESHTWGKPRKGFYWTPRLRFIISPGGNQMFERIDPFAVRSGLSSTQEFTLEGVQPAAQEAAP